MTTIAVLSQLIIALGIVNVWVLRRERATAYRPAGAHNIREEFEQYGFPSWAPVAVGGAKLILAGLLIVGIFIPAVAAPAAVLMAALMVGAIGAHIKVGDPLKKSVPAAAMLLLSILVIVGQSV
ncbi:MAG: DoxX family protein [Gemmatimonadetes bacterium]|nr:DoxX family protein [Gemmatimonadota bacterium]